jgi:hypothetical protein
MPNFRTRIGIDRAYYHDNWEERQLAAILFHILNLPGRDNVERLLRFATAIGRSPILASISSSAVPEICGTRWAKRRERTRSSGS